MLIEDEENFIKDLLPSQQLAIAQAALAGCEYIRDEWWPALTPLQRRREGAPGKRVIFGAVTPDGKKIWAIDLLELSIRYLAALEPKKPDPTEGLFQVTEENK